MIPNRSLIFARELAQGMHERLRDVLAAETAKASSLVGMCVGCLHLGSGRVLAAIIWACGQPDSEQYDDRIDVEEAPRHRPRAWQGSRRSTAGYMKNAFKLPGALSVATLALVILALAPACTPATIVLDHSDNGAQVRAVRGDFVTIALPSFPDPDGDPGWVATQLERKMLRAEEEPRFVERSDAGEAPGVQLFRYRVMADGETTVRLDYTGDDGDRLGRPVSFSVTFLIGGPAGN